MNVHRVSHKAPKVATVAPQVPLTTIPAFVPEIQIRRGQAYIRKHKRFESRWLICIGSHYVPTPFPSSNPWTIVAFWIQTQTQGPVNVIACEVA